MQGEEIGKEVRMENHPKTERYFLNVLMTLITSLLAGTFYFLWSVNGTITIINERDRQRTEDFRDLRTDVKELKLHQTEMNGRIQRVEDKIDNNFYLSPNNQKK